MTRDEFIERWRLETCAPGSTFVRDVDALLATERRLCAEVAINSAARCDGMAKECAAAGRNDFGWVCRVIGAREIADEILQVEIREKSPTA